MIVAFVALHCPEPVSPAQPHANALAQGADQNVLIPSEPTHKINRITVTEPMSIVQQVFSDNDPDGQTSSAFPSGLI